MQRVLRNRENLRSYQLETSLVQSDAEDVVRVEKSGHDSMRDMFANSSDEEGQSGKRVPRVGYQTLVHDVSAMEDQEDLGDRMGQRKVRKIKKVTTYKAPEEGAVDEEQELFEKSGIRVNFLNDELLEANLFTQLRMPVNLQYISREDSDDSMMLRMSDIRSSMKFLISKRYSYVFETKAAKLNSIITVQELKKDRATQLPIITMMKIDRSLPVFDKVLGNPLRL